MGVKFAANVFHGHEVGQSAVLGTLDFVVSFSQLGFDKGQTELRVKIRLRCKLPRASENIPSARDSRRLSGDVRRCQYT